MHSHQSISVRLAKEGYDVWLGNNRGNIYSRKNTQLDPAQDYTKFFDYSFFELGKYDAPTQIDYVLKRTKKEKLSYIGHSQGTSQMFSTLSEGSDLNSKLDIFVALAPIVNLANTKEDFLVKISKQWHLAQSTLRNLKLYEIRDPKFDKALRGFCNLFSIVCNELTDWFELQSPYSDDTAWQLQQSRPSSSASSKQLIHYAQIIKNGVFRQYDYGSDAANKEKYGSRIVPLIPLSHISQKLPIALFVGKQDTFADEYDVMWLKRGLGKRVVEEKVYNNFDHFSFQIGKDMSYVQDVIDLLKQYATAPASIEDSQLI